VTTRREGKKNGEERIVKIDRRRFIANASRAMTAGAAAVIADAPNVIAQPKVQWGMSTAWTAALDILQGAAQRLGKVVEEMSGGRFRIEVFPGGQIMQAFECFDAASQGKIEAFMATGYYWVGKEPALECPSAARSLTRRAARRCLPRAARSTPPSSGA
jgi:TRAP-type mannitol/chloroaromatic compound transport system substrate-binding protein